LGIKGIKLLADKYGGKFKAPSPFFAVCYLFADVLLSKTTKIPKYAKASL